MERIYLLVRKGAVRVYLCHITSYLSRIRVETQSVVNLLLNE